VGIKARRAANDRCDAQFEVLGRFAWPLFLHHALLDYANAHSLMATRHHARITYHPAIKHDSGAILNAAWALA
jgi:hypothetical protein